MKARSTGPVRGAAPSGRAFPEAARRGMTLVEVLLALAILGVGLTVLVSTTARGLSIAKRARHFETARHLMSIVELENPIVTADRDDPAELVGQVEQGSFEAPFENYRWTREIEYFGPEQDRLFQVATRIWWGETGGESFEESVTLLHSPSSTTDTGVRDSGSGAGTGGAGGSATGGSGTGLRAGMRARTPGSGRNSGRARSSGFGPSDGSSRRSSRDGGGSRGGDFGASGRGRGSRGVDQGFQREFDRTYGRDSGRALPRSGQPTRSGSASGGRTSGRSR